MMIDDRNNNFLDIGRTFGWFLLLILVTLAWKQTPPTETTGADGSSWMVNGFFFQDKFERLKRITLPSALAGLGSFIPGLSSGVRVCINFNPQQYPQGYQQNTCFLCDAYRFHQIAYQCTGQTQIPSNINFTQANCIMNTCQPMMYPTGGNRYYPNAYGGMMMMPPNQQQQQYSGVVQSQQLQQHPQQEQQQKLTPF